MRKPTQPTNCSIPSAALQLIPNSGNIINIEEPDAMPR